MGLEAEVWPSESAAYGVNIMWEGLHPTQWLCNSRFGALASLNLVGMEVVSSQRMRVDPVKSLQIGCSLYFKTSPWEQKKQARFHPGGHFFLRHLIIWAWNHNACQMKKWCRRWKSLVFRENIHGPGRLSRKVVASPNFLCQSFELQRKHISLARSAIVAFNSKCMNCH